MLKFVVGRHLKRTTCFVPEFYRAFKSATFVSCATLFSLWIASFSGVEARH